MTTDQLRESLLAAPKNGYATLTPQQREEMNAYCKRYAAFLDDCKTEREATAWAVKVAEENGFRPLVPGMELKPGDKVYRNNRDKAIMLAVIGSESLNEGSNICAAHVDAPRMDLKPTPLYEDSEIAYFKTHYYGGIKKYQWTTVPLALHGVVSNCFVLASAPWNLSKVSSARKSFTSSPTLSFSVPSAFLPFRTIFFFLSIL